MTEKIQHLTLDYILCDEFTLLRDLQYKVTQAKYGSADFEGKYLTSTNLDFQLDKVDIRCKVACQNSGKNKPYHLNFCF